MGVVGHGDGFGSPWVSIDGMVTVRSSVAVASGGVGRLSPTAGPWLVMTMSGSGVTMTGVNWCRSNMVVGAVGVRSSVASGVGRLRPTVSPWLVMSMRSWSGVTMSGGGNMCVSSVGECVLCSRICMSVEGVIIVSSVGEWARA